MKEFIKKAKDYLTIPPKDNYEILVRGYFWIATACFIVSLMMTVLGRENNTANQWFTVGCFFIGIFLLNCIIMVAMHAIYRLDNKEKNDHR